jgi:hypothetical protein
MKKNFVKSLSAAIIGLSLTASCSALKGKEAHKCASNNSCSAKKDGEAHKCAGKKAKGKKAVAAPAAAPVAAPTAAPKPAKK